jgi:hypothetical protein
MHAGGFHTSWRPEQGERAPKLRGLYVLLQQDTLPFCDGLGAGKEAVVLEAAQFTSSLVTGVAALATVL